jgi:phospholipase C
LVFGQRSISQPDNYRQDKEQEMMTLSPKSMRTTTRLGLCASAAVIATFAFGLNVNADDDNARHDGMRTRTPIKHVIVIIGENRSFDHVFGLYEPKHGQRIANLLSKGIVKEDGTPGPNFAKAAQFTVLPQRAGQQQDAVHLSAAARSERDAGGAERHRRAIQDRR